MTRPLLPVPESRPAGRLGRFEPSSLSARWVSPYVIAPWMVALGLALSAPAWAQTDAADEGDALAAGPTAAAGGASVAGVALTVDTLVERGLAAHPDLRAAALAVEAAQAGVVGARALPNPRVDWTSGSARALPGLAGATGTASAVTLAQPLENPWLRQSRREVAESGLGVARQQRSVIRNDVVSRVRTLAAEMEFRRQEAQAFAESLTLLEQVRERIKRRVEVGEAPRYDLIKADAEIITARQRAQQAALMMERTQLALDRLAAGTLPAGWTIRQEPVRDLLNAALPELPQTPPSRNPELQVLQQQLEQARAAVGLARSGILPSVDVTVTRSREPDIRQNMAGLSMTVPLLDQRRGPIAQARAEALRAQTLLEGRQAELLQELRLARKSLEMALSRVRGLSQGAILEAEAAVRVAEAAWRFGERGILDVLDAQRVLRALRADLIQARFEAQAALIEIERLEGRHAGN